MLGIGSKKTFRQTANKIFEKNTKYHTYDIAKSSQIHNGYTNVSYYFRTEDGKAFQVRIGNDNNFINRENEKKFLDLVHNSDYIYLNTKNGDAIKKWIIGIHPNKKTAIKLSFIKKLNKKIDKLHAMKLSEDILKHDYNCFLDKSILDERIKQKYLSLIDKYKNEPLVMSHNDLNPDNMLILEDNSIYFIDYEWARLNHPLWDICNYMREVSLPIWKMCVFGFLNRVKWSKLKDHVFICTCYAYQWTFYMEQTDKIKKYRQHLLKQMTDYYKKFY